MKTKILLSFLGLFLFLAPKYNSAQILIQFWDFNQVRPISGAGGDSVGTTYSYSHTLAQDSAMGTWPLVPSYSKVNGAKMVYFRPQFEYSAGTPENLTDCDGPGGAFIYDYSSSNYTYFTSSDSGFAEGNAFLKARNPSDSCEMYMYIPTTGYKGISLQYALSQSSVKGAMYNIFNYSTDNGATWKKLTSAMDTFTIGGGVRHPDTLLASNPVTSNSLWFPVTIDFSSDHSVDNNANFILKWMMAGTNTTLTSGNDRYDNFAVWAQSVSGINELTAGDAGYNVYPNPVSSNLMIEAKYAGEKEITIYNTVGQQINTVKIESRQSSFNVNQLASGVYFMTIKETESGSMYTLKFVKS